MIAKIPTVIPSKESKVRNLFAFNELKANEKLSNINRIRSIAVIQFAVKLKLVFLIFGKTSYLKIPAKNCWILFASEMLG